MRLRKLLHRRLIMIGRAASALAALLGLASPTLAEDCRLALVLALDVSGSVDTVEDQLQRDGLAQALLAPEVVQAFLAGAPVAVHVFEWSGPFSQVTMPPGWQLVEAEEDLVRIAAAVGARSWTGSSSTNRTTALGKALSYAAVALEEASNCEARVVDISGNGVSNIGPNPRFVYESGLFDDITVNALVIKGAQVSAGSEAHQLGGDAALAHWFQTEVLHGPGAFLILADSYVDYERAMRAKLLRELVLPIVSGHAVTEPSG
jgi:type II secretory pathway pseudopilin PulG